MVSWRARESHFFSLKRRQRHVTRAILQRIKPSKQYLIENWGRSMLYVGGNPCDGSTTQLHIVLYSLARDCLQNAYDEALIKLGYTRADGVIICTGDLRGDKFTNQQPAGHRVLGIWLLAESDKLGPDGSPIPVDKEEVLRNGTRKYLIMVGEYMFEGGDGYDILRTQKLVITAENGQSKSALIRKYLLGLLISPSPSYTTLISVDFRRPVPDQDDTGQPSTDIFPKFGQSWGGDGKRPILHSLASSATKQILDTAAPTIKWLASQRLVSAALKVAEFEDMGLLDPYERQRARMTANLNISPAGLNFSIRMTSDAAKMKSAASDEMKVADEEALQSLPVIHPTVDGRLKNVAPK
ncbi:Metallo-dependent phosphatase [Salix suchowensis]|nr:Metallo-dependent phosphatase [Salix suchowensis]